MRPRRRGRWPWGARGLQSAAVVALALAVGGAALATALRGEAPPRPIRGATASGTTRPTAVTAPLAEGLAALPSALRGPFAGRLAVRRRDCRLLLVDLASGRSGPYPGTRGVTVCSAWLSPSGRTLAWTEQADAADARRLQVVDTARGRRWAVGLPRLDALLPPAVTDEGTVATGSESGTVHLTQAGGGPVTRRPGQRPVVARREILLTRPDRAAVERASGGVAARASRRPFPPRWELGAGTSPDGRLLGVWERDAVGRTTVAVQRLDGRGRRARQEVAAGGAVTALRLSPQGDAVALGTTYSWELHRLDTRVSAGAVGRERIVDASFSPDGRHVAAVTLRHLVLLDATTFGPLARVPIDAVGVTWLLGGGRR